MGRFCFFVVIGVERERGRENGSFPVAESSESASAENRGFLEIFEENLFDSRYPLHETDVQ